MSGLSPKTVTGTVLEYTVDGLSPYVNYTVECTSSNGEDSCDSNMDTIRMPSAGELCLYLSLYRCYVCVFVDYTYVYASLNTSRRINLMILVYITVITCIISTLLITLPIIV